MTPTVDQAEEMRRLRWQCRRGMLELDLLLIQFLEKGYNRMSGKGKSAFSRLLGYQDQVIYDWLTRQAVPADPELRETVRKIREVGGS
ncbi:MAG: succinate dehydrogenase assembly factor 2 [Pseudomonadota bacterium]|nr:succinate dehydrogenase assembly factor 2 [Pseudomonadota bacterium]